MFVEAYFMLSALGGSAGATIADADGGVTAAGGPGGVGSATSCGSGFFMPLGGANESEGPPAPPAGVMTGSSAFGAHPEFMTADGGPPAGTGLRPPPVVGMPCGDIGEFWFA